MSRSRKKHCGGKICCNSDKYSKRRWHKIARRRDNVQTSNAQTEQDIDGAGFWKKKQEITDNWTWQSDGGSHFEYADFEHYYQERLKSYNQSRVGPYGKYLPIEPFPTREAIWQDWIKYQVGK